MCSIISPMWDKSLSIAIVTILGKLSLVDQLMQFLILVHHWPQEHHLACCGGFTMLMNRISSFSATHSIHPKSQSKSILFNLFCSSYSSSTSLTITDNYPTTTTIISNPLYNFLPQTQNPNNLVNLISSSLKKPNSKSHLFHLGQQLNDLIPHLNTQHISRVLLRCQCEPHSALTFFNWVKNDLGIIPTPHNYSIIVHILVCSHNFVEGMSLLNELIQLENNISKKDVNFDVFDCLVSCTEDCNWNPVVFDMLIKAYVKVDHIEKGYRTFKKMVKLGFVPHVLAFNCLLNGLSKFSCIDKSWELYKEMWQIGVVPNTCTFNILTNVLCKDRNVDKVNEFIEKMEEEGFEPDIVTYNTLIGRYCRNCRLYDAFYLYRIMYRRGVMPDLYTYTSLMNGLCKVGRVKEARQVFCRMIHRGMVPDIVAYNSLILGYCKEGRMKEVRLLVHEMIGTGIKPDDFTCQVLVEGYGRSGRWHSCLNMVVELQRFGVPISGDTYKYLIVSLAQGNHPFVAVKLLDRMVEEGHEPDEEIYGKLIKSLCGDDHLEEAFRHKSDMIEKGLKPSLDIYQNLISCLCRLNRCSEAEALMQEMILHGLKPDNNICRELVFEYCKAQNIDKAESLLISLATEYQLHDLDSCNLLFKARSEHGGAIELMELQDKMMKLGFAPNGLTCKYVLHGLQNAITKDKDNFQVNKSNTSEAFP